MALLDVNQLQVSFHTPDGVVPAVAEVSFSLEPGRTLALVGESGSGKSTTGWALLGLLPRSASVRGEASFAGTGLLQLAEAQRRKLLGSRLAMISQDPASALNPVLTVGRQLTEVLEVHRGLRPDEARAEALKLLEAVQLPDAERRLGQYPHQLSGGQRQRVLIAMALLCRPSLLIADEPTSALDVTLQAKVLTLFKELSASQQMAMLLITHDLGVVASSADEVAVMYAGRIVERGPVEGLFASPLHPYTRGLLESQAHFTPLPGQPPDLKRLPPGCPFHPRCPVAKPRCSIERPPLEGLRPAQLGACWVAKEVAGGRAC